MCVLDDVIPFFRKIETSDHNPVVDKIEIVSVENLNNPTPFSVSFDDSGEALFYYGLDMGTKIPLHYEITFRNTSNQEVNNFCYFSDPILLSSCLEEFNYNYVDGLSLRPGEELTINDSVFLHTIAEDRGLFFMPRHPTIVSPLNPLIN